MYWEKQPTTSGRGVDFSFRWERGGFFLPCPALFESLPRSTEALTHSLFSGKYFVERIRLGGWVLIILIQQKRERAEIFRTVNSGLFNICRSSYMYKVEIRNVSDWRVYRGGSWTQPVRCPYTYTVESDDGTNNNVYMSDSTSRVLQIR